MTNNRNILAIEAMVFARYHLYMATISLIMAISLIVALIIAVVLFWITTPVPPPLMVLIIVAQYFSSETLMFNTNIIIEYRQNLSGAFLLAADSLINSDTYSEEDYNNLVEKSGKYNKFAFNIVKYRMHKERQ